MDVRRRAKEVFLDALHVPPDRRSALIAARCGEDAELRRSVDALMRAHADAETAFGPGPDLSEAVATASATSAFGAYRLSHVLGEGGFGVVWLAQQAEPIARRVAIKLLKASFGGSRIVERFAREREAMARMDHPGIAKVLDAGATPAGQPFVVMELVDGAPITVFCDTAGLSLTTRVQLFLDVCDAVQHAHHKGVVHRDLKPGNLLVVEVDGRPRVKVIDFGIAKAIGEDTLGLTVEGQIVGTPEFMAPEQATPGGVDIDTRADVYSLGVVLYHLLTGTSPYDRARLDRGGLLAWSRAICDETPLSPSRRVLGLPADARSAVARARGISPSRLPLALRGDLDWIVQRALHKDRSQRYPTAVALAADLERFLRGEPIEAGPPSRLYRLRKLCARHRVAVTALAVAFVTALVAAGFSAQQAAVATRASRRAELASYTANVYAAAAAVTKSDAREAGRRLAAVPPELRQLEWHLLAGEIDRGERVFTPATARVEAMATHARAVAVACGDGSLHVFALGPDAAPTAPRTFHGLVRPVRELALVGEDAVLWAGDAAGRLVRWDWQRDERVEAQLPGAIESLDVAAGSLVVVACEDGSVRGYAGDPRAQMLELRHAAAAQIVRVDTAGQRIAVGTADQQLTLWDRHGARVASARPARASTTSETPTRFARGNVSVAAFAPDGLRLAVATRDGHLSVLDRTGTVVWASDEHTRVVRGLVWSPPGDRLFAIGRSIDATLWQADGKLLASIQLRGDGRSAAFSPDGERIVTAEFHGGVRLWDGRTGESRGELLGHEGYVYGVASTPDGDMWSFGADATLRRWQATLPRTIAVPLSAWGTALEFGPHGELVIGDALGRVLVWDVSSASTRASLTFAETSVSAVLPLGGGRLVCGLANGQVIWLAGQPLEVERRVAGHAGRVAGLALVAGGREIASSGHDGRVRLYSAESAVVSGELACAGATATAEADELRELSASGNGARLCAVSKGGRVCVFDVTARRVLAHYDVRIGDLESVAVDRESLRVAVGGDRDIALIDTATGAVTILRGHTETVTALAWSPDGRRLVSASRDATVRVWDPQRAEGLLALPAGPGVLHAVAISRDGRRVGAAGEMGMVRLWDAGVGPAK